MEHDDDGANQAYCATNLAQAAQLLVQKVGAEDGADKDGESSQGSDEDGGGKGVCGEIEYLAKDHCRLGQRWCRRLGAGVDATLTGNDARPPHGILEISKAVAVEAMLLDGGIEALFGNDKTRADGQGRAHGQHESYVSGRTVSGRRWVGARRGRITYLSSTMMAPCRRLCDQSRQDRGRVGVGGEGGGEGAEARRGLAGSRQLGRGRRYEGALRSRRGEAWRGAG